MATVEILELIATPVSIESDVVISEGASIAVGTSESRSSETYALRFNAADKILSLGASPSSII